MLPEKTQGKSSYLSVLLAVEGLGEWEATTLHDTTVNQWRKYMCESSQDPPAFRMPGWGFVKPADAESREQGRRSMERKQEETTGNDCTVALPRGWLVLYILGLWSSLELVLILTLTKWMLRCLKYKTYLWNWPPLSPSLWDRHSLSFSQLSPSNAWCKTIISASQLSAKLQIFINQ